MLFNTFFFLFITDPAKVYNQSHLSLQTDGMGWDASGEKKKVEDTAIEIIQNKIHADTYSKPGKKGHQ